MLDVCFNNSVAGGLAYSRLNAKNQIIALSFDLSFGDISLPISHENGSQRGLLLDWITADPRDKLCDAESLFEEIWTKWMLDLERLQASAAQKESIRMWVDHSPQAACNFLYTMDLLKDFDCEISLVALPRASIRPNKTVVKYKGWGEVCAEEFAHFSTSSTVVSNIQTAQLSEKWKALQSENASLRVVENGQVVSSNIEYYDDYIRKEYPQESCFVSHLIGNALGRYQLPISDFHLAQRLRVLIEKKELNIIAGDVTEFYKCVIARNV